MSEAIVLQTYPLKESDLVVSFQARDPGSAPTYRLDADHQSRSAAIGSILVARRAREERPFIERQWARALALA